MLWNERCVCVACGTQMPACVPACLLAPCSAMPRCIQYMRVACTRLLARMQHVLQMGCKLDSKCCHTDDDGAPAPPQSCRTAHTVSGVSRVAQGWHTLQHAVGHHMHAYTLVLLACYRWFAMSWSCPCRPARTAVPPTHPRTPLLPPCSALSEVRIPPGPRLLILHHVDMYRNPGNVLKPALPLPPLPPPPPPAAVAANYAAAGARPQGK